MATQADTLISFIDDLRHVERRLRALTDDNAALIRRTRAVVADTFAQIGDENSDGNRRENGTFMPMPRDSA